MLEFREGELTSCCQHDVLLLQRMKEDAAVENGTNAKKAKQNTLGFSCPRTSIAQDGVKRDLRLQCDDTGAEHSQAI